MNEQTLVAKVWNLAHVLRDEGVSYQDYLSQISFLLFLKMDQERDRQGGEPSPLADDLRWGKLASLSGEALTKHYGKVLEELARRDDVIGTIFLRAENKISDPARLQRVIAMIGEQTWLGLDVDVKGAIYEGLLERNASEVRSGAGQYFTPRPVIEAIVQVMDPEPHQSVHDPAVGTGGFLLAAYEHMRRKPEARDRQVGKRLRNQLLTGNDIVAEVVRMCAMNLYLHGLGSELPLVKQSDALQDRGNASFDMILTNPPFGKRQSFRIVGEDGRIGTEKQSYVRDDFIVETGNKQLNFLQHIMSVLKPNGSAAVVLPDNVLFEGGAGETLRRRLLDEFDLHTILRLPTGIFYSQGVKANVLFFERMPAGTREGTQATWVYDLRTNMKFTLKERTLARSDMADFIDAFRLKSKFHERRESERFKSFDRAALFARDKLNLDISWLKDENATDPDSLPPPDEIAADIVDQLEEALSRFRKVAKALAKPAV